MRGPSNSWGPFPVPQTNPAKIRRRVLARLPSNPARRTTSIFPLTVFPVVENLCVFFYAILQGLPQSCDGLLRGERPAEELAGGAPLHHLRPRVAGQAAEAVRTVDDVALSVSDVRHQKRTIWNRDRGGWIDWREDLKLVRRKLRGTRVVHLCKSGGICIASGRLCWGFATECKGAWSSYASSSGRNY